MNITREVSGIQVFPHLSVVISQMNPSIFYLLKRDMISRGPTQLVSIIETNALLEGGSLF